MSLLKNRTAFRTHLRSPYRGALHRGSGSAPGPVELLSLDLSSPTQQEFGATAASGAILPGKSADDVFLFDDAGSQVSSVASESLASSGNVVTQRPAPGFYNGTDMVSKLAANVETIATAAGWESAAGTFFDVGTESFVDLAIFRMRSMPTAARRLWGNWGANGYLFHISNFGRLTTFLDDGSFQNVLNTEDHYDGTYTAVLAGRDQNAVLGMAHSILQSRTAALTATASMTDASPFQFGEPDAASAADAQLVYFARFSGADAEGLDQSDLLSWFTHGDPPSALTYERAGNVWSVVDDDVTFGLMVAPWSADKVPTAYRSGLASSFGMEFVGGAVTNLADTDVTTDWTHTTITPAAKNGDSPDRFDDSHLLTATAANGTSRFDMTTVVSTDYALSIFYRRSGGADVTFDLEMQRSDTSAVLATSELTATSAWQRATITAAAATTTTRALVRVITDTEAIEVWHPQMQAGEVATGVVAAYTAAGGASSAPTSKIDNAGNVYLDSVRGELEMVCIKDAAPVDAEMLLQVRGVTDDDDRLDVLIQANDTLRVQLYNSTGTLVGTATTGAITWTTEQTVRVRWNSAEPISGYSQHMDVLVNGSRTASDITATWTPGPGGDEVHLGSQFDGSEPLRGLIASLSVYDQERPD